MGNKESKSYDYNPGYSGPSTSTGDTHYNKPAHKITRITDQYKTIDEVTNALRESGLESSNLILGIDFTKSNEWTGKYSFDRRSLHAIGSSRNPYEQAIYIIGRTLSPFDEDSMIPCYGFGDASTHDQHVFSFLPNDRPCHGFEEALACYRGIVPHLRLAGPTSFAPIINTAMGIVERSGGQYHVLVIIADGQVTRSSDIEDGQLSPQEQKTIEAIVAASHYPLSIVLVGVGDGPWDAMQQFDDNIPRRNFDNFQFVNFTAIMSKNLSTPEKEAFFALSALMEIPVQYKAVQELRLLGHQTGNATAVVPLPPPVPVNYDQRPAGYPPQSTPVNYDQIPAGYPPQSMPVNYDQRPAGYPPQSMPVNYDQKSAVYTPQSGPTPAETSQPDSCSESHEQCCPICLTNPRDLAFSCGHTTCQECGQALTQCPLCRAPITSRLRLYST